MDINQEMVLWLVDRIKNGKINPITKLPFTIDDIKVEEYKNAVKAVLYPPTETDNII